MKIHNIISHYDYSYSRCSFLNKYPDMKNYFQQSVNELRMLL